MNENREEKRSQNREPDSRRETFYWRLARSYNRPHIEVLKVLYSQPLKALVTKEVYQKTRSLDISERQKRNIFTELDEDGLLDYTDGSPALLVKKDGFDNKIESLIEAWNEVNTV